jgi:hypothetical protein
MASIISAGTTSGTSLNLSGDTSGVLQLASNGSTTAVTIDTSQNVGIGTASPAVKFDVTGTVVASGLNARITNTDTDASARAAIQFKTGASSNVWQTFAVNGALVTGVAGVADYMRITSDGIVWVGASSGAWQGRLSIQSNSDTSYYPIAINNTASGTGSFVIQDFYRNGTRTGTITATGSATAYNTSSDYRLKENIAPMVGALATIQALKPVTFNWKIDGSNGQGFIAHELQAVVPDCVSGEKDAVDADGNIKPQGIDTSFLVATLTAAIQELKAELDATKAEVQALKGVA